MFLSSVRCVALQIKISLHHQGGCVRKYAVPDKMSLTNVITLSFKTSAPDKNMLLFHLADQNNVSMPCLSHFCIMS